MLLLYYIKEENGMKRKDVIRILVNYYVDSDDKRIRDVIDFVNDQNFKIDQLNKTIELLKCSGVSCGDIAKLTD
jgi:retron-type reverse transcriptase